MGRRWIKNTFAEEANNIKKNELRQTLAIHLETLKRNLDAVPLETLKTKYKRPFERLRQDIAQTTSAYVKEITLKDIRIRKDFFEEARPLIENAIQQSGILKQISAAAFRRQDLEEIDALALELKSQINSALKPFYDNHLCLYLTPECFAEPPKSPEIYNEASGCISRDGAWIPWEIKGNAILLTVHMEPADKQSPQTAAWQQIYWGRIICGPLHKEGALNGTKDTMAGWILQ